MQFSSNAQGPPSSFYGLLIHKASCQSTMDSSAQGGFLSLQPVQLHGGRTQKGCAWLNVILQLIIKGAPVPVEGRGRKWGWTEGKAEPQHHL